MRRDWIESFVEHTAGIKSPEIFRRWAAVSSVASAMQRCVWTRLSKQQLFPNIFILLIAYPGIGKSNAIKFARGITRRISDIRLSPSRITPRAFYNELATCKSDPVAGTDLEDMYVHHSITAMIEEFSIFVRPRANEFMADLADLYDCNDPFEHKTSTQGELLVPNPWFNMIGGATPTYLRDSWTSTVLDEGFPARCIIVYSDESIDVPLFAEDELVSMALQNEETKVLEKDLRAISKLRGRMLWDKAAGEAFQKWFSEGMPPRPEDARLLHYCERRKIHIGKLAMIFSASRDDSMCISMEDFENAKELMLATEQRMLQAIETMGASPLRDAMLLTRKFVQGRFAQTGSAVMENQIRALLVSEVDPMKIGPLLQEMANAGMLEIVGGDSPFRRFVPGAKG